MSIIKRILLIFLGILVLVEGYLVFSFIRGFDSASGKNPIGQIIFNGKKAPDKNDLNILIIGSDSREKDDPGRSDSLMVAHYDQKKKTPKIVSIMRDSYVDIPKHGMDKINAAFSYGGIELVRKTLDKNFDLPIEYYMIIDFQHFVDAVDTLFPKGVTINAEKDLDLDGVFIKEGKQSMDGNTLLQYARFRKDEEGDFGRVRRQQQVMSAIASQVTNVASLSKLPQTTGKLLGYVQTNLPKGTLVSIGTDFVLGSTKKVESLSVPVENSWQFNNDTPSGSVLEIDENTNTKAIKKFLTE